MTPRMTLGIACPSKTKKHDQTAYKKCRKVELYGEIGCTMWGDFISQASKSPRRSDFSGCPFAINFVPEKVEQESSTRDEEKKCCFIFLGFATMTTIRPRTPSFGPGKTSIVLLFLVR